jgi:hypothetical protein
VKDLTKSSGNQASPSQNNVMSLVQRLYQSRQAMPMQAEPDERMEAPEQLREGQ